MSDLKSLTERYFRHPDDGGDYLSVAELNLLCGFQHVEIVGLEAEIEKLRKEVDQLRWTGEFLVESADGSKKTFDWVMQRAKTLESELETAAALLQDALPIGKVKHLGVLEVAAAVKQLLGGLE